MCKTLDCVLKAAPIAPARPYPIEAKPLLVTAKTPLGIFAACIDTVSDAPLLEGIRESPLINCFERSSKNS